MSDYIVTIQYWSHVIHGLGMRPIHHRTSCACVRIVEQPLHQTTVYVRLYSRLAYSRFAYFRPKSGRSRRNGRRQTGNIPILHGPYNVLCATQLAMQLWTFPQWICWNQQCHQETSGGPGFVQALSGRWSEHMENMCSAQWITVCKYLLLTFDICNQNIGQPFHGLQTALRGLKKEPQGCYNIYQTCRHADFCLLGNM